MCACVSDTHTRGPTARRCSARHRRAAQSVGVNYSRRRKRGPVTFLTDSFEECKVNTMFTVANAPSAESGPRERARRFPRSQLEGVGPARIPAPPVLLWHQLVRHWPLARSASPTAPRRRAESTDRDRKRGEGAGTGSGWVSGPVLTSYALETTHPGPTCNQLSNQDSLEQHQH